MTALSIPPTDAVTHFRFGVEGMSCASCVGRVEKALATIPGVTAAAVNLATESAEVHTDGQVAPAAMAAAMQRFLRSEPEYSGVCLASCSMETPASSASSLR